MRPSAYIIGSGPSLLRLTKEEKDHLNKSERTLSLNSYLHHWEKIGVLPKCHAMADGQFPAIKMLVDDARRIERLGGSLTYYISSRYFAYFPKWSDLRGVKHAFRKRWEVWRDFSYWVPLSIPRHRLRPFSQISEARHAHRADKDGWFWSEKLSDPLYFFRGTLTSAINLAAIIWPECDIRLVGIDLNTYGYFFDPKVGETQMEKLHKINEKRIGKTSAVHHRKSHRLNNHATAVAYDLDGKKELPGIQMAFPRMVAELQKTGRRLLCSNPDSLLVEQGVLPFASVIPEE